MQFVKERQKNVSSLTFPVEINFYASGLKNQSRLHSMRCYEISRLYNNRHFDLCFVPLTFAPLFINFSETKLFIVMIAFEDV